MASKNFSYMLSSAMQMTDGSEEDDSLFGEDDLLDNELPNLDDDELSKQESPTR